MKIGITCFSNKEELKQRLFEIAQEQFESTVAECFIQRNTQDIHPPEIDFNLSESADEGLQKIFDKRLERLSSNMSKIKEHTSKIRKELSSSWDKEWLVYCNGRKVLRKLINSVGSDKSFEDIRDMVSVSWDSKKHLPPDINKILKEISDF